MNTHPDYAINKELGECYLFMGDFDKAEGYYRKAVTVKQDLPEPYLGLATVAVQRGDLATAQTLYAQALALKEDDKGLA
ncbi:MAG: tetratricopeptide repeat protein, partial [Bilophila sp.]